MQWRLVMLLAAAALASLTGAGRVAVLIHGESFRLNAHAHGEGGAHTRGKVGAVEAQRLASLSHLAFLVIPLRFDLGYAGVDLFVETFPAGEREGGAGVFEGGHHSLVVQR